LLTNALKKSGRIIQNNPIIEDNSSKTDTENPVN
jgi:hypothetical protein